MLHDYFNYKCPELVSFKPIDLHLGRTKGRVALLVKSELCYLAAIGERVLKWLMHKEASASFMNN